MQNEWLKWDKIKKLNIYTWMSVFLWSFSLKLVHSHTYTHVHTLYLGISIDIWAFDYITNFSSLLHVVFLNFFILLPIVETLCLHNVSEKKKMICGGFNNDNPFYQFNVSTTGALLGGDLNNSNGGCPSPVREYDFICSEPEQVLFFSCFLLSFSLYSS